jgi:hypothetical protein
MWNTFYCCHCTRVNGHVVSGRYMLSFVLQSWSLRCNWNKSIQWIDEKCFTFHAIDRIIFKRKKLATVNFYQQDSTNLLPPAALVHWSAHLESKSRWPSPDTPRIRCRIPVWLIESTANSRRPNGFARPPYCWPTHTFSDKYPPACCPSATSTYRVCALFYRLIRHPGQDSLLCILAVRQNFAVHL